MIKVKTLEDLRNHVEKRELELSVETDTLDAQIQLFSRIARWCLYLGGALIILGFINPYQKVGLTLPEWGSYLSGSIASLFSLAGIFYIYIAFLGQKQQILNQQLELLYNRLEIKESQEVLRGQKDQLENQNKTQELQKFEAAMYNMLGLYNEIMSSFSKDKSGKTFFADIKNHLREAYEHELTSEEEEDDLRPSGLKFYEIFYNRNKDELAHYLRVLYRIFKFIDNTKNLLTEEQKWFYMKIVRAQLSEGELFILFYNSYTDNGSNFLKLVLKYNLLKHLPITDKLEVEKYYRKGFYAHPELQLFSDKPVEPNYITNESGKEAVADLIHIVNYSLKVSISNRDSNTEKLLYGEFKNKCTIKTNYREGEEALYVNLTVKPKALIETFGAKEAKSKIDLMLQTLLRDILYITVCQDTYTIENKKLKYFKSSKVEKVDEHEKTYTASIARLDKTPLWFLIDKTFEDK